MDKNQEDFLATLGRKAQRGIYSPTKTICGLFPVGFCTIIASPPGVGKTWISTYIACQLTIGGTILNGLEAKAPERKVVFFSGETGGMLISQRLDQTIWPYNPDNFIIYSALEFAFKNVPYMLNTHEGQATFLQIIEYQKPQVIWIDTLISYNNADESKQTEMTAIYVFLNKIAQRFKVAIIINHHTRKQPAKNRGGVLGQDDVIGTSAGIRLAHSVYILQDGDSDDINAVGTNRLTLRCVKSWDKKPNNISFTFCSNEDGFTDFKLDTNAMISVTTKARVLALLFRHDLGNYIRTKDYARLMGESAGVVRYHLLNIAHEFNIIEECTLYGERMFKISATTEDMTQIVYDIDPVLFQAAMKYCEDKDNIVVHA